MLLLPTAVRRRAVALLGAAALVAPAAAVAQPLVRTVGAGAGCDFDDLQEAIDFMASQPGADKELRLDRSTEFAGAFEISETSLTIAGGFEGCDAAAPGNGETVLRGVAGTVVEIDGGSGRRHTVRLSRLEITGGTLAGDLRGGGVEIQGNAAVELDRVDVTDNRALLGGGVFINGGQGATLSRATRSPGRGRSGRSGRPRPQAVAARASRLRPSERPRQMAKIAG